MKTFIVFAISFVVLVQGQMFGEIQMSIIDEINSQDTTWTAGVNEKFVNMTLDQVKRLMGSLEENVHEILPESQIEIVADIPDSFDPRDKWPNCTSLKEVRDQSDCGSCWAFGAVEAMSDRLCIASGQTDQTRISSENLLSCCSECGFGCSGGYPTTAWQYYHSEGLVTGDLYGSKSDCQPYTLAPCAHHVHSEKYPDCPSGEESTPSCSSKCQSGYPKLYEDDLHWGGSAFSVRGIANIQTELMTNGPCEVSITVYADFPAYKSGVYQHKSGQALGGHAIKLMGWGVENGVDYWLLANSWNESWGDQGYFKMLRGSNECGVEGSVVGGGAPSMMNKRASKFLEFN